MSERTKMTELDELKKQYRNKALTQRDLLSRSELTGKSRKISERLFSTKEYKEAQNILVYVSVKSEVSTNEIIERSLETYKRVYCPSVISGKDAGMEFYRISGLNALKSGYMNIPEPGKDESERYTHNDKDTLIIVPGTAFDKSRTRIGYGGSFYDRYLRMHGEASSIGICFSCQLFESNSLPFGEYDIKPAKIICEDGII